MNSVKLICLLMVGCVGLHAQTIKLKDKGGKVVNRDTLQLVFHPGADHGWTEIAVEIFAQNMGNVTLTLGAKKTEYNMHRDEYHAFCFGGTCFDSTTFISPFTDFVQPGGIDSTFSGHYRFDDILHAKSECLVAYTFYDVNNPDDSAIVYVNYNTMLQSNGLKADAAATLFLSEPFPNPANELVFFQCDPAFLNIPVTFIINSLAGERVLTIQVPAGQETFSANTSAFPSGLYYCSMFENNVLRRITKLMVMHE